MMIFVARFEKSSRQTLLHNQAELAVTDLHQTMIKSDLSVWSDYLILINVIISYFLIGLCLLRRQKAVFVFCLLTCAFNIAGYYLPDGRGLAYYLGAAVNDLLIIFMINNLKFISRLAIHIQTICKVFIFVNFFSWILWMLYVPVLYFNWVPTVLYAYAIILILIDKGADNVGNDKLAGSYHLDSGFLRFFKDDNIRNRKM